MKQQNFKNHHRYVPGFHIFTFAVILAAFIIAIISLIHTGITHKNIFFLLVSLSLGLLFYYIRKFATVNQDRIILVEENFRNFRLTGKILDSRLSKDQIIALRFADDCEFVSLSEKAIRENLSQNDIKKAIQNWRADNHRV